LRHDLDLVFIGINPSVYSATQGHYFARKINRFWPAFSRSVLSENARRGLGGRFTMPRCWHTASASPTSSNAQPRAPIR
jgi:TDG/mug DNA glycosylase family protein